ncbi:hypothetical protein Q5752_004155 [Cryptotrichosporon argae]
MPLPPALSDDDLDELGSDSEYEDKPALGSRGPADSQALRGQLMKPHFVTMNLKQIHDMIHFAGVDLNPPYQRDVVWPESKMIGLIQSLFLNYFIPPIIFAVEEHPETGDEVRVCIDGKQRCTSIINFMDGKIPFKPAGSTERYWYHKYNQKTGKQLPENLKRKFDQISLQVVEYNGLSDTEQRDIFQRVQLGVALSAAEKLQAVPGPWAEWINELQKKYIYGDDGLGARLKQYDTTRGNPFKQLATIVMLCWDPASHQTPTSQSITKFVQRVDPPEEYFRRKLEMALSIFVELAVNHYDVAFGTVEARMAPVEMFFTGLLIFTRMGNMSVRRLAGEISEMRTTLRARHRDIRSNNLIMGELHVWVSKRSKARAQGEVVAAEQYEGDDPTSREARIAKRKRDHDAEAADPSFRGQVDRDYAGNNVAESLRSTKTARQAAAPASEHTTQPARTASRSVSANTSALAQPVQHARTPSAPARWSAATPAPPPAVQQHQQPQPSTYDPYAQAQHFMRANGQPTQQPPQSQQQQQHAQTNQQQQQYTAQQQQMIRQQQNNYRFATGQQR